jgi:RNA polymerase sigma factor (sigma-70 family)
MDPNKQYRRLDTKSLVDKCINRDAIAWAEFIFRFAPIAERAIAKRLHAHRLEFKKEDISDMKQEFFVKLWEAGSLVSVKNASSINYWIAMVSANFATDFFRRIKRDALTGASSMFEELADENKAARLDNFLKSAAPGPGESLDQKILEEKMEASLASLNPKAVIALKLNIFHGMKHDDIAIILKMPPGTISSLVARAKEKIRKDLQEK